MPPKTDVKKLAAAKWASSGITDAQAKKLRLQPLTGEETRKLNAAFHPVGSLLIPYFNADGKPTKFYRIRYLENPPGFAGVVKKPQRYAQVPGSLNEVYLPPLLESSWSDIFKDTDTAIYITEGELKAAAASARGLPTIGLGGVDVWRSQKRKLPLLPQLETVEWKDRQVVIIFDSDAATNPDVVRAQRQLSRTLLDRGAEPVIAALPPNKKGEKQGLDDFLVKNKLEDLEKIIAEAEPVEEASALWELNEEVVLVRDPALVVDRVKGTRMQPHNFSNVIYANRQHFEYGEKKPKKVNTAKKWLEWPNRFQAERLVYMPGQPEYVDGCWNLWKGWGVEPKRGDVGPWLRLLDYLFAKQDKERQWFERWCAYPLQFPGTKLFSSVAIWGVVQGTGKTLVGYTLKDIYGPNAIEIRNHNLTSGFNSWADGKQFVIGDEITGSDKRVDADRLKGLITQEEAIINAKYLPEYSVKDCTNYYFTSNNPDAFFLDDTDRRFFIHEVVGKPAEQSLYDNFDKWRKNGGPAHLFDYLLRLPVGDFKPKGPALSTKAKEEMTWSSKSDLGTWCRELLADPKMTLKPLGEKIAKQAELITPQHLLRCYDPEGATKVTANGLGRELRRCGARQTIVWTSMGTQRMYIIRRPEHWTQVEPNEAAKHWEEVFGPKARKF